MGGQAANLRQRWALLGIILLAFLLRVYSLGRGELWFDEALSTVIAAKGWAGILQYTLHTPFEHPPLYYLSLHAWTRATGTTEFALRFFSLFCGVLLVPLLYRFMASWGGQSFGLLVALVCALSAVHIDHSQNARMYSLLPLLGVLLLICFLRGLETSRLRWWLGFLAVSILGIVVHYYFSLMLLVPLAFLLLSGKKYRRQAVLLFVVLVACVLLVAAWFGFSPGFRQALEQVVTGEGGGVSSLGQRVMHTAGGLLSEPPVAGHVALALLAVLGVVFWPLLPAPANHPVSQVGSRRFVLAWLLVPWLVALAIPYWLQDRHLAYLLPAIYALVACGLLVLRSRSQVLFLAGLILMGATTGYWLYRQDAEPGFEFGAIMTYIEDRALPDDLIIMNQPAFWPFEEYYAQGDLETAYVPAYATLPDEALDSKMRNLVGQRGRIWLGPIGAWTEDPESRVEQWLVSHAYQAYKEWFAGGGSAALYFTTNALEPLTIEPAVAWEDRVRLVTAYSSSPIVTAGDAIRLAFGWQATEELDSSLWVSLYLVDDESQVWATRQSEPCGGWCPTDAWEPAALVQDQHALLIPKGTPPGSYRLQVALYAPDEGRELVAAGSGQRVDLGPVHVMELGQAEIRPGPRPVVQYSLEAGFGNEIDLLGFDLTSAEAPAGGTVALDLYWQVQNMPSDDYELLLELILPDGKVLANWKRPLVADAAPTSVWLAGQFLRGPHQLSLPGQVAPGEYDLRLKVLDPQGQALSSSDSDGPKGLDWLLPWQPRRSGDGLVLGRLLVTELPDRSHNFELPAMANTLRYRLGQQVDLLGYDLDIASAAPGGQLGVTLYWQARGATVKPYKVFTHLGDGGLSPPVAQHDDLPGEGCCPPNTWVQGEVVVDRHLVPLPADLDPGTYLLTAGMYDEPTGLRLSVFDAQGNEVVGDRIPIAEVVIHPRSTPAPLPILPKMNFRIYLPLVEANQ